MGLILRNDVGYWPLPAIGFLFDTVLRIIMISEMLFKFHKIDLIEVQASLFLDQSNC
jgi:hypothetical protein